MQKGGSKLLWKWEKEKEQQMHLLKLQEIKNRSSTNPGFLPEIHNSVFESAQRQQHFAHVQSQRQVEIEKQNEMHVRRLLRIQASLKVKATQAIKGNNNKDSQSNNKNISLIQQNKEESNNSSQIEKKDQEQQGQLMSSSFIQQTNMNNFSQTSSVINKHNKSKLNSSKISPYQALIEQRQTLAFFRRIEETKSVFDTKKWMKEAAEHSKALMVCSKFTPDSTIGGSSGAKAARHSRSSQEIRIPNSLGVSTTSMKRESQQDRSFNNTGSLSSGSANLQLGNLGNVTVPSDFMMAQSSDSQKMHYIKKILEQKKQVLYRKTAEIEGEQFFAEIRIENNNFYINLENAQGMIFSHNLPQAEGSLYFQRECNGEFEQLFRKITLNRTTKGIHLQQTKSLYKDSQIHMSVSHIKSRSQPKYVTSKSAIFQGDESSDTDRQNNSNIGLNNQTKRQVGIGQQQLQVQKQKQVKITTKLIHPAIKSIQEKDGKKQEKISQQNQIGAVKVTINKNNNNQLQNQQKTAAIKLANNGDKSVNKLSNLKISHAKEEQQKKESQLLANKQSVTNKINNSQGINKPINKVEQVQKGNNNNNRESSEEEYDEDYEDPFEKFDEEDRKNKEERNIAEVHNDIFGGHSSHHHELTDKKMSSFSFQQTTQYKKNGETEKIVENNSKFNKQEQQKQQELDGNQEEEENYEYEEESSGTQYEINDEDKVKIQNENKQIEKNGIKNEKEQQEGGKEVEEEYADEFE